MNILFWLKYLGIDYDIFLNFEMKSNTLSLIPSEILNQWQKLVDFLAKFLKMDMAFIAMVNPPKIQVVTITKDNPHGFKGGEIISIAGRFCEKTVQIGKMHVVEDLRTEEIWRNSPESKTGLNSYLGLPLYWSDGQAFGTFCLKNKDAHSYNDDTVSIMENYRQMIQAHLELVEKNIQLYNLNEELTKKYSELTKLLTENRILKEFLPICAKCKKIRDENGIWHSLEQYISAHTNTVFSHGLCDECAKFYLNDLK